VTRERLVAATVSRDETAGLVAAAEAHALNGHGLRHGVLEQLTCR